MSKIIHYTVCSMRVAKKYMQAAQIYITNNLKKYSDLIRLRKRLSNLNCSEMYTIPLSNFYPDQGRLSVETGFIYDEPSLDLTIIIPMFNVELYIAQCLESVLQPTAYALEIILVDDGSTDHTLDKIKSFLSDPKIRLLRQKNAGQSAARNIAISQSRGKYLMFVDGDDILLDGAINSLLDAAISTGSDIAEGRIIRFRDKLPTWDSTRQNGGYIQIKSSENQPEFVLKCYGYSPAKIYHRQLWENLRFPEGYIFEDVITKFILRRIANQVAFIQTPVYGYRWNPTSSSHGNNSFKKLDSIWVFPKICELCSMTHTPTDEVFYLLSLNHISLLNFVTVRNHERHIKEACFLEMRKQLTSIQKYRPKVLPFLFFALEKAILSGSESDWEYIAEIISKHGLLKKWREIN